MNIVILDGAAVNPGDLSWEFLSQYGTYTAYDQTPPDKIVERLDGAEIVLTNRARIDGAVLKACPTVRMVSALGTGYDMIDLTACRAAGVEVANIPGYSTDTVAQFAFTLLLSLSTDVGAFRRAVRDGKWTGQPSFRYTDIPFVELAGQTVGLYGCGAIGARMAELCAAFGMRVLGYRRSAPSGTVSGPVTFTDPDTLLAESDFVSLHCPLSEETRGLVNRSFLERMKPGAYLINTSRGAVVDETALYEALTSGRLAGAALDVMVNEPPSPDNPLLTLPNCLITPHCAWTAVAARKRLLSEIEKNIKSFCEKGIAVHRVF